MADDRIADFIQPVNGVQRKAGTYHFGVLFVDFGPVNVENHCQDKNEGPVEILRAPDPDGTDQVFCLLRTVSPELQHIGSSFRDKARTRRSYEKNASIVLFAADRIFPLSQ